MTQAAGAIESVSLFPLEHSLRISPWPLPAQHSDLLCELPALAKHIQLCFTENKRNEEIRLLGETKYKQGASKCLGSWSNVGDGRRASARAQRRKRAKGLAHQVLHIHGHSVFPGGLNCPALWTPMLADGFLCPGASDRSHSGSAGRPLGHSTGREGWLHVSQSTRVLALGCFHLLSPLAHLRFWSFLNRLTRQKDGTEQHCTDQDSDGVLP